MFVLRARLLLKVLLTRQLLNQGFLVVKVKIPQDIIACLTVMVCVTDDHAYILFVVETIIILLLSSFIIYHRICIMTGATNGAGIAYSSRATSFFIGIRVIQYLVFCDRLFGPLFDLSSPSFGHSIV